jgi:hypothetical protein
LTTPKRAPAGWHAFAAGAVLLVALGLALVVLTREDTRLAGTNSVRPDTLMVTLRPGDPPVCQTNVLVPRDTGGVRALARTSDHSRPTIKATLRDSRGRLLRTAGASAANGSEPVLEFSPVEQTVSGVTLCLRAHGGQVAIAGQPDPFADNVSALRLGRNELGADLSVDFVERGERSLLNEVPAVFHRASLFRPGWVGAWTFYALAVLALGLVLAAILVVALPGRPVGRAGVAAVAAIAFGNAFVWSLVTPAFQPPDEAAHFAYVESIVERGELPSTSPEGGGEGSYTLGLELAVAQTALGVVQNPTARPPWTEAEEQQWRSADSALGARRDDGGGGYTTVAGYSPLYYGIEAIPYAAGKSVFTRLWLMRLPSALMIAGAAAFAFLFVRELLPNVPWAAPVAGLAVAFEPMLGFIGGALNNDALLILLATAELYLLARALRRGLDVRLAAAIGAVLALGIVTKPNMLALVPAAVLALAWLLSRDRARGAQPATLLRFGGAAVGSATLLLAVRYAVFPREEAIGTALTTTPTGRSFSLTDFLSYTWQWYLPSLPFMEDRFAGAPPAYDVFFKGFWATFGHLDTKFAPGVYGFLLAASAAGVALMALAVWRRRATARQWAPRALLALLAVAGLALLVNLRSYLALIQVDVPFAQGRYLLPAIAVFGLAVAVVALGVGRRLGSVAGTALVTAIGAFNLFSLGLVLTRFYT